MTAAPVNAMTILRRELNLCALALTFLTRIPVPFTLDYSAQNLNQANRYFSLVGLGVGVCLAAIYVMANSIFSEPLSVTIMLVGGVLLTGAFHEDGLADTFDGIVGGATPAQRLTIMKDSRIGTYGTLAVVGVFTLKVMALSQLAEMGRLLSAVIVAHTVSRAVATSLICNTAYVADESTSKSKPLANQQSLLDLILLLGIAIIPVYFLYSWPVTLTFILVLGMFRVGIKWWFNQRLGGYTGDNLGAAQQIAEVLTYLLLIGLGDLG